MAEMRTTVEIRIYKLILNPMRGRAEDSRIVAISDDYDKLVAWYHEQFAPEMWRDDHWWKRFKAGSPLEWYNDCSTTELNNCYPFGHGIQDEWVRDTRYYEICGTGEYFVVE